MLKRFSIALFGILTLSACSQRTTPVSGIPEKAPPALQALDISGTYAIDPSESKIQWEGKKVLVPSKHTGTIAIKEGKLELDKGQLKSGTLTLDMGTINNEDQTGDMKAKLEGHLKSADFFDVGKFPTATLAIKEASQSAPGQYKVNADLTIKGIVKPVEFDATAKMDGDKLGTEARIEIDRTQWGLKYGSGSFFRDLGDKVIDDKISFEISLVAVK
jgi:polyisoprenoid-binding protein YceI